MHLKQGKKLKPSAPSSLNPIHSSDKQPRSLLKEEKSKIQNKLEALRAEIAEKKNNKNKDTTKPGSSQQAPDLRKTSTRTRWNSKEEVDSMGIEKFLKTQQNPQKGKPTAEVTQLQEVLRGLKMEAYVANLEEHHIRDISQLLEAKDEEIEQWKDIPVGFRIRLKKFNQQHRNQTSNGKEEKPMDIEGIIERRKDNRVFVPITGRSEMKEEEADYGEEGNEEDALMQSLEIAFKGRRSMMNKESVTSEASSSKKSVKWHESVNDFTSENSKSLKRSSSSLAERYPNEQTKQKLDLLNSLEWVELRKPSSKETVATYCWQCLKKANDQHIHESHRSFCSEACLQTYVDNNTLEALEAKLLSLESQMKKLEQQEKEGRDEQEEEVNLQID